MTGHEIFRLVAAVVMIGTGVYLLFSFDSWDQLVAALQILIGTIMAVDVSSPAPAGAGVGAGQTARSGPHLLASPAHRATMRREYDPRRVRGVVRFPGE